MTDTSLRSRLMSVSQFLEDWELGRGDHSTGFQRRDPISYTVVDDRGGAGTLVRFPVWEVIPSVRQNDRKVPSSFTYRKREKRSLAATRRPLDSLDRIVCSLGYATLLHRGVSVKKKLQRRCQYFLSTSTSLAISSPVKVDLRES